MSIRFKGSVWWAITVAAAGSVIGAAARAEEAPPVPPVGTAPAAAGTASTEKNPKPTQIAADAAPAASDSASAPAPADTASSGADRSIRLSGSGELLGWGTVAGSMRQGIFSRNTSNSDFLLTHVHPKLTATLGPKALAYGEFCITHPRVGPQPEQAYFEYDLSERLNVQAGRFLVPFGQWNQIHDVFDHKSIAYPLMYLGHEEEELALQGGPTPIVSTAFTDIGVLGYGSFWPFPSDQIWYGAYICNGRFGGTNIEWEDLWNTYRDNNSDKAYGGRAVWTHGDNLSIGGSYQTGHYDPENKLRYQFAGADLYYRIAKKVNLRAEYVQNPIDSMVRGYTKTGWYVSADMPVGKKHEIVAMYSHLREYPADAVQNLGRASIGFNTYLTRTLKLKTELDHIMFGHFTGDPTNPTDTQFGTSFQDTTRIRASLVAIF
jgi:hypothetical protein